MTQSMGPISLRVETCLRENSWFLQTQMDRGKMGAGVKDIGATHLECATHRHKVYAFSN